ncbi:hypothetical protein IV454_29010 [Massilia antarctica]|uniref:Uncharacterized protein n=1 Tax=Massilia antarctica TaxID=2765360 RepID=A0AA48WCI1_9BURK|nr:hypothetical protein [Massilia antarctica]QPI49431.1 hypothetical protein IV454_29010 [Massilia antarctica]
MNDLTKAFLARLSEAAWFENVGRPEESPCGEIFIFDWEKAIISSTSTVFTDVTQDATNKLTTFLDIEYPKEYLLWNKKVKNIRPVLSSLVTRKVQEAARKGFCPPTVSTDIVRWTLVKACLALEYSDYCKSPYFEILAEWYLRGHFPCGWAGEAEEFKCSANNCPLIIF